MNDKYKLRYSPEFVNDLESITFYISHELKNIIAAENLLNKIEDAIMDRLNNPLGYEQYKTKAGNVYYRLYINNYVVFYTVTENVMEVRRIIYGRKNF